MTPSFSLRTIATTKVIIQPTAPWLDEKEIVYIHAVEKHDTGQIRLMIDL